VNRRGSWHVASHHIQAIGVSAPPGKVEDKYEQLTRFLWFM